MRKFDSCRGHPRPGCKNQLICRNSFLLQPPNLWSRAQRAWNLAGRQPIGLHEVRHTFASVLIAAGVDAKAITTYMGHASIQTTYGLYGTLMPSSDAEAASLVDAYLARAGEPITRVV